MHIPDADDDAMAAFEAHEIDRLVAFCGQLLIRHDTFPVGGASLDSPVCDVCAELDGWSWDEQTGEWVSPYEEAHQ
jgi:hypothetical protein